MQDVIWFWVSIIIRLIYAGLVAILSAQSKATRKIYESNVSPCSTPARISKNYVSPLGDMTCAVVLEYLQWPAKISMSSPCHMESNTLQKLTNFITAGRFFNIISSIKHYRVRNRAVVDLTVVNPFWFMHRFESKCDVSQLRTILLYSIATIVLRVMPR